MTRALRPLAAVAILAAIAAGCSNGGDTGTASSSGEGRNATARQKAVKFSECMRDNGVEEFPDPNASGDFTIEQIANGSAVDTNTPGFTQAMTACRHLEPPGFTGHKRSREQQAAALEFAQCIRENGVKDFPDPAADAPLVDTNRIPSSATPEGLTILNAAMRKCRDFGAAAGATGGS